MPKYYRTLISATNSKEANKIADVLLNQKLIAGALITKGLSKHWWKGKIDKKEYFNISAFTFAKNKVKIIKEVEKIHKDDCPIVAFIAIDGNEKFLKWIELSTQ
jgi:uncharacterized protein involved in tolerance to divalent cations